MRVGLVVNLVTSDRSANLAGAVELADEAARAGAELVLLPEAAVTGLVNNDDPSHDLSLGEAIPGRTTETLCAFCAQSGVWLGIGLLERDGGRLYDSAILISRGGEIEHIYRRITPGWHGSGANPLVYRHGKGVTVAETDIGAAAFLICGDLFDDRIVAQVRGLAPRWLLVPFARTFDDGSCDQARWDELELPMYLEQVRLAGSTAFMTNYISERAALDGGYFGGAMVVSKEGELVASLPLGQAGVLVADARA